jgi:complement component 1 Q subcomponent-binding protein
VSTLSEALQHEIDEEAQNPYNDMPSELSDLKLELSNDWTIMDGAKATSTDGAIVNMYKQENLANGSKVTITFHCQDSISPEEMGFLQNAAETAAGVVRGEEDEEEESMPVKFDVLVSRAGKEMRISCTSDAGEATIDGIMVSSSEEGGDDEDMYRGPMIEDLAEGLQASLEVYLREECGVTSDVAAFIAMYADFKEQDEYINWLKNVKNIVG